VGKSGKMIFFGSYDYALDDKGRLVIPAKIRGNCGPSLFAMRGFEQCLSLFTKESFNQLVSQVSQYDYNQVAVRQYMRLALASVIELPIDDHGRIQLPADTIKQFQFDKNIKVIGVQDHLELWDLSRWQRYEEEQAQQFETNATLLGKK
jgi:MraZ protein